MSVMAPSPGSGAGPARCPGGAPPRPNRAGSRLLRRPPGYLDGGGVGHQGVDVLVGVPGERRATLGAAEGLVPVIENHHRRLAAQWAERGADHDSSSWWASQ